MKTDHILRQVTQYWTGSGIHTTHAIKIWTDTRQMTARFGITTNRCQIWGELCSGPIILDPILPLSRLDLPFRSATYVTLCNKHNAEQLVSLTPVPNKATPLKLFSH